jgi:L-rhamnose mutarotase
MNNELTHTSPATSPGIMRRAFVMSVNPGMYDVYKERHRTIFPELLSVLKESGVNNYSIFYHHTTRQLFAYAEIEDEKRWNAIGSTEACQKWWKYMSDIMPCNEDSSPAATKLTEVFHLD